jgi:DNA segregation ATPase FtsK/SpoIIIE, S-DNA-T family
MNSLISGLIFHKSPKELRFLMIDPKMIELSPYNGIPHLLKPVVTDVEEAKDLLLWAEAEMDRRYQIFSEMQAKNIISFNQSIKKSSKRSVEGRLGKKINWDFNEMPYIVIVIDELADLMLTQRNEVERPITRIAQKARAAGIHMVMATQRPSSDIVTGLIKTNFPTRVSFKVSSNVDSRTILDQPGAEKLLGNGDMLYMAQGKAIERLQGSYMSEDEVKKVVRSVSAQGGGSKGSKS